MKILFFQGLLSLNCMALSWLCDYSEITGPTTTHVLYKEETSNVVKWLEKYEYCRAKGDPSVYEDAGQPKCEYSRNICVFNDECIFNQNRENDPLNECQDLLDNNILSNELDSGRIRSVATAETESVLAESVSTESVLAESVLAESVLAESVLAESVLAESVFVSTESVLALTESVSTESVSTESVSTKCTGTVEALYSSATRGAKSLLLLFVVPFFI